MIEFIQQPWPWYIAGPLIGLTVPLLLWLGNKSFGISSTLRDICAACIPMGIPFFEYNWKENSWNLFLVLGIVVGGFIASTFLGNPNVIVVSDALESYLVGYGIHINQGFQPSEIFSWTGLFTLRGFLLIVLGGFMVGFGTRYAGGCTSGHSIMGLSNLQWPSLVATIFFMLGGFFMTHFILPFILNL